MRINYEVTGAERKLLVGAIKQELNVSVKYLGMPTAAYEVGEYTINKAGTLTGPDSRDLVASLCETHNFMAVSEEYDTPHPEAPEAPENIGIENDELSGRILIEMPRNGFTDTAISNLEKLVESKAALIKKAIGVETLPLEMTHDTLRFPWFPCGASGDEVDAYTRFVSALCTMAKEQKRVTAKEKPVENEKFAFRVFLIRLGFIGTEYKNARKILLSKLSGNSAFKNRA